MFSWSSSFLCFETTAFWFQLVDSKVCDNKFLWLSGLNFYSIDSIQNEIGQCIIENAILLSKRKSPIVNKLAPCYVLQLGVMAIPGIHPPIPRFKIILPGESRKNCELWRAILKPTLIFDSAIKIRYEQIDWYIHWNGLE